jgi:hypothetical protein
MTVEEIYIKLRDELTAENESSSSPERIFIKNEEQTICTLGMNRSHEIIFVEFKPAPKDLAEIEREGFVHPHPVEMLHDAGWRQAQITTMEEAEKLLEIIHRSYKRKRPKQQEDKPTGKKSRIEALKAIRQARQVAAQRHAPAAQKPTAKEKPAAKAAKGAAKTAAPKHVKAAKPKPAAKKAAPKAKPKAKPKPKPAKKAQPAAKKKKR